MTTATQPVSLMEQPLSSLKGVGPKIEEKLNRFGLHSVQDLLFHLPLRYQDRTSIQPMGSLRPGSQVVIEGEIDLTEITFARKRMLLCHISDGTGSVLLRFFHFSNAQKEALARGTRLRCFGEVRAGTKGLEMVHPEYDRLYEATELPVEESLTPVYPVTEGVHQLKMRDLTRQALDCFEKSDSAAIEYLPDEVLATIKLPAIAEAIENLHQPTADIDVSQFQDGRHPAQQRLAFEELLAHTLSLRELRHKVQKHAAPVLSCGKKNWQQFEQALPFNLTRAQQRVIAEIRRDITRPVPMMRLVQGDVGSGKTIVAAAAALDCISSGYQAALMAPTEILAEQHVINFRTWLEPLGIQVGWLSGRMKVSERRSTLEAIASGDIQMIVGTHALFQDEVNFNHLALVVIDEQHRFGVHQRMALRDKGKNEHQVPHQLIMTATPIPRTLAMTAYADLDVSVIDELPPGRKPVNTVVIPESRRGEVLQRVKTSCAQGSQAYWVCTLIDESEVLQCQAAAETSELLQQALPELQVGLIHGRLKPAEKEVIMARFKAGEIDLLVATTVIEVGVDVPNANLMVIENVERLGLSQLHQLRGRVGRGHQESNCVLIYQGGLSQMARFRLAAMRETNDGFIIAERDLELRGPGEVLGTKQTGLVAMRIADVMRDQSLMPAVHQVAETLHHKYPQQIPKIIRRWLGDNVQYGDV